MHAKSFLIGLLVGGATLALVYEVGDHGKTAVPVDQSEHERARNQAVAPSHESDEQVGGGKSLQSSAGGPADEVSASTVRHAGGEPVYPVSAGSVPRTSPVTQQPTRSSQGSRESATASRPDSIAEFAKEPSEGAGSPCR